METMVKMFVMLSLIIAVATTPFFSNKDIHFGIRMANIDRKKLKKIRFKFIVLNIIAGVIGTYLMLIIKDPLLSIVGLTFGYLGVAGIIYILAYNEVKLLKNKSQSKPGYTSKGQVTVVDTSFAKEKGKNMTLSSWYFLIPVLIVMLVAIISLMNYDLIPDPMPMHYNAAGQIDGWADKTYLTVLMLPLVSLAMTGLFYFMNIIIGKSKQQLNVRNPQVSSKQNRKYRKIWSGYTLASAILMNLLFAYMQLEMIQSPVENSGEMMYVTLGFTLLIIVATLAMAIYTGKGGRKLKVGEEDFQAYTEEESEDDHYWKWGSIYYNPDDPSVFVEKRLGIGWTVNMGTLQGKLILVGTIAFTIIVVAIAAVSGK